MDFFMQWSCCRRVCFRCGCGCSKANPGQLQPAERMAGGCCKLSALSGPHIAQVARNKQDFKQRPGHGLTVQQWRHIAPHLLLLAEQLPLKSEVRKLVASEEHKQVVQRFVEDPPREGEPHLPRLRHYWPPAQQAPAAAPEAAGTAQGAGHVAARGQGAAATAVQPRSATAAASSSSAAGSRPAGAAAKVAAATPAGSSQSADGVIDLTQSDSDGEAPLVSRCTGRLLLGIQTAAM